jgi:HSP20 family protein
MALIKWTGQDLWEPFQDLEQIHEEMNRLFGQRFLPATRVGNGHEWCPEVDIIDEKDHLLVRADLPGMKQEEISVEVADNTLTIKGERKHESETKEGTTYRAERSYGSFLRSFTLPAGVDAAKVAATYKNGVLEIRVPKLAQAQTKQIKVDVK